MKIDWYFDFISPFSYLAWPRVRALSRQHAITFKPFLFAGLLDLNGTKGPAEIPAKRTFSYRHLVWQARQQGVPLRFPPTHPFNPLPALRLCIAAGNSPEAIDAIFRWIWEDGRAADSVDAIAPLAAQLGVAEPASALSAPAVKDTLRRNYDDAVAAQVFGVPTFDIDGDLFWGNDAVAFATAVIDDPSLLSDPAMTALASLPIGIARR